MGHYSLELTSHELNSGFYLVKIFYIWPFHTGLNDYHFRTSSVKLLEDLNVRGATAFIHLVQNADEFGEAVSDLENVS
jgi:hypothetical protein